MFDELENPYASPIENWRGQYDWTLAKRLMAIAGMFAFFYLALVAVPLWKQFRSLPIHRDKPVIEALIEFSSDWRSANQS